MEYKTKLIALDEISIINDVPTTVMIWHYGIDTFGNRKLREIARDPVKKIIYVLSKKDMHI